MMFRGQSLLMNLSSSTSVLKELMKIVYRNMQSLFRRIDIQYHDFFGGSRAL